MSATTATAADAAADPDADADSLEPMDPGDSDDFYSYFPADSDDNNFFFDLPSSDSSASDSDSDASDSNKPASPQRKPTGPRAILTSQVLAGGLVQVFIYVATIGRGDYEPAPPQDYPYSASRTCSICRRQLAKHVNIRLHKKEHALFFMASMQGRQAGSGRAERSSRSGRNRGKKKQQRPTQDQLPGAATNFSRAPGPSLLDNALQLPTPSPSSSQAPPDPPLSAQAYYHVYLGLLQIPELKQPPAPDALPLQQDLVELQHLPALDPPPCSLKETISGYTQ